MKNSRLATMFIATVALSGLLMFGGSALKITAFHHYQFASLLIISVAASRMKIKLPGMNGNMSVNLPFILIAAAQLSLFEAVTIALISAAVQSIPKAGQELVPARILFNAGTMTMAAGSAGLVLHSAWLAALTPGLAAASLVAAGSVFFLVNTLPVATILSLTEGPHLLRVWSNIFHLSFPYYLACTGLTSVITAMSQHMGWQMPLIVLPATLLMYRSYRMYFAGNGELAQSTPLPQATKARAAGAS